jgi:hypothetical protein
MPDDPQPPPLPAPRPVIPIESDPDEAIDAQILGDGPVPPARGPAPVMPIAEPGVMPPAPFAQVYSPPPVPPPATYYPPAYPPPAAYPPAPVHPPAWTEPVDYRSSTARTYGRPGIITAIAVTGIIVAALSMITTVFSGCTSMVVMTNSRSGPLTPRTTSPKQTGITVTVTKPPSVNALAHSNRTAVVYALSMKRALSDQRRQQLETFLSEHGKLVFDDTDGGLTSEKISQRLGGAGQEFSNGKTGPEYFIFKSGPGVKLPGRLRLFDDRAVFKPDDYSPDLRSEAKAADETTNAPAQPAVTTGLEDDQVRAVINQIKSQSGNNLNAAQSNTLTTLLQSPSYANWLQDSSTIPGLTAQVKSAAVADDGSVIITFNMGKLTLDPQGNTVGPMPAAPVPATMPSNTHISSSWAMGTLSVNQTSCSLGLADALVSELLAIYLLVIAIMTLRRNPIARKFYLIYIAIKIIIGVVAVCAFAGIVNSLNATSVSSSMSAAQAVSNVFAGFASAALTFSIIGLLYPIVILLVLMFSKTAKDFYKSTT